MATAALDVSVCDVGPIGVARSFDLRAATAQPLTRRSIELASDGFVAVVLDGPCSLVVADGNGQHFTAKVTTANLTTQSWEGEHLDILSSSAPVTALSLSRVAGQATTVELVLGQSS